MKIAIDFDGTLIDSGELICRATQKLWGREIRPEFLFCHGLVEVLGISQEQVNQVLKEAFCNVYSYKFVPGANLGLFLLDQMGLEIIIDTKRPFNGVKKWLELYNLEKIRVIYLNNEPMERVDYLIDDYPSKIVELLPFVSKQAFLLTQPWNRGCMNIGKNFIKVNSWKDFLKELGIKYE